MVLLQKAWPLVVVVGVLLAAGCGKSDPVIQQNEAQLKEIHEMYQLFLKSQQKPPTQLSDLANKQNEGIYPGAVNSLKQGKYVVVWGVNAKDSGTLSR